MRAGNTFLYNQRRGRSILKLNLTEGKDGINTMSFTKISRQADRFYAASGLPLNICQSLALYVNNKNRKQLAIFAEKNLLTEDQSEGLKERGLTILDAVEGGFGTNDEEFVYEMFGEWNERLGEPVYSYQPIPGKDD